VTSEDSPFARLLAMQPTEQQREHLHDLRHDLALHNDDPVWAIVAVVEDFCLHLQKQAATSPPDQTPPPCTPQTYSSNQKLALLAIGAVTSTGLMTLSFYAGFLTGHTPRPPWLDAAPHHSWATRILSAPAGWMAFAQALPIMAYVTLRGWHIKHTDPLVGWTLIGAATTGTLLISWGLGWLLRLP